MSFTTLAYYRGEISLPQNNDTEKESLTEAIDNAEKKYLLLALGYQLYTEFIAGLSVVLPATPAQKWLDLRDGKTYTVTENDKTYTVKWNGLKNTEMKSFLSYFTYFDYVYENFTSAGIGSGMFSNTAENVVPVNPKAKLTTVFNKGLDLYGSIPAYECISDEIGTGVAERHQFNFSESWFLEPSLFNFIYYANLADPTTYPNWVFTGLTRKNLVF